MRLRLPSPSRLDAVPPSPSLPSSRGGRLALGAAALAAVAGLVAVERATRRAPVDLGPVPPGSRTVTTDDGVTLHVEVDEPTSPPDVTVLLVHGFTARLGEWELQRATLRSGGDVRVVAYDQRDHGRSGEGSRGSSTFARLADDLARVLADAVPPGPVVLAGHSMGGMVVLALAGRHPHLVGSRVAGAFLMSTAAGNVVTEGPLGRLVALLRRLDLVDTAMPALRVWLRLWAPLVERSWRPGSRASRAYYRHFLFGSDDATPEAVDRVAALLEEMPFTRAAHWYPAFVTHDETAALATLRDVPTTVLVGSADRLTPRRANEEIAERLGPSARLVVVPGAGHSVNITRREVVDEALAALVARVREQITARPAFSGSDHRT